MLIILVFHRIENSLEMEKRQNAGYQHFDIFPGCFNLSFSGPLTLGTVS